jgi:hypothetical protein
VRDVEPSTFRLRERLILVISPRAPRVCAHFRDREVVPQHHPDYSELRSIDRAKVARPTSNNPDLASC